MLPKILICLSFVLSTVLLGSDTPEAVYQLLEPSTAKAECRKQLRELPATQLVFALPQVKEWIGKGKSASLLAALSGLNSDLLVKNTLELEQEFEIRCGKIGQLQSLVTEIKRAYLNKLGMKVKHLRVNEVDLLFRGLLATATDFSTLKEQLAGLKKSKAPKATLEKLFGPVVELDGVLVLGLSKLRRRRLQSFVGEVCGDRTPCPFWNGKLIYKAIVTSEKGLASYIPEVGVLVLSQELLDAPNLLHKVVLLHELTHVATRHAQLFEKRDWVSEFSAFSGWQKKKGKWESPVKATGKQRKDELTTLSKGSAFSILPDYVYLGKPLKGKALDGFVLGKAYQATLEQNNPAEDLADHVAVFYFKGDRFCYQGKPIAPQKYDWIAQTVFPNVKVDRQLCGAQTKR